MIHDDIVLQATDASKTYDPTTKSIPAFRWKNVSDGSFQDIKMTNSGPEWSPRWYFVLGSERNRRSLLGSLLAVSGDPVWLTGPNTRPRWVERSELTPEQSCRLNKRLA